MSASSQPSRRSPRLANARESKSNHESEHELLARCFKDLEQEFRTSLELAQRRAARFRKTLKQCISPNDLRKQIEPWTFSGLMRGCRSQQDLLDEPRLTQKRFEEICALNCGLDHIAEAASLVLRTIKRGLLKSPPKLWREIRFGNEPPPRDEEELKRFWSVQVIPRLKEVFPERFNADRADTWHSVRATICACQLLSDLVKPVQAAISTMNPSNPNGAIDVQHASREEWLHPTSLVDMANRLGNVGVRKIRTMLKPYELKSAGNRQTWTVRIDTMPKNMREALEK